MGDGIEPVERQHAQGGHVPPEIAPAMVDQLMLQRETLLGRAVAPVEQWRHDDALVQHANRHGTVHGLALYDADAAALLGITLAWAGTDAEQEGAVRRLVPDPEFDRPAGPHREQHGHPLPGSGIHLPPPDPGPPPPGGTHGDTRN